MKGSALGLTCRDAFQVFSQNETLTLQTRVTRLENALQKYEPMISHDEINPAFLLKKIMTHFDEEYPPDTRQAPVPQEGDARSPFSTPHGDIWSGTNLTPDVNYQDHSLRAIIEEEFMEAIGKDFRDYCYEQSFKAISTIKHALVGAYMASQWINFSVQKRQEYVLWQALLNHMVLMKEDLELIATYV